MKILMTLWLVKYKINEFRNFVEKFDEEFKKNEGFYLLRTFTLDAFY